MVAMVRPYAPCRVHVLAGLVSCTLTVAPLTPVPRTRRDLTPEVLPERIQTERQRHSFQHLRQLRPVSYSLYYGYQSNTQGGHRILCQDHIIAY